MVLAGAGTWTAAASGDAPPVHRTDRVMTMDGGVRLDTSYFTEGPSSRRRPAVLLAHGFGGSKADVRDEAEKLARDGYAVLTWSARGFGRSTGRIGLNDPKAEVADVSRLVDWLARRPEVRLDKGGDPRVGVAGASYGGAVSLLAAANDPRVDAIAPSITYWNLADALFPNGVFKKLWAGIFLNSGGGCARFEPELCAMYNRVAESGKPDAAAVKLLQERSPSAVGDRIKVPTLTMGIWSDMLYPAYQQRQIRDILARQGTPCEYIEVDSPHGHDAFLINLDQVGAPLASFLDGVTKHD